MPQLYRENAHTFTNTDYHTNYTIPIKNALNDKTRKQLNWKVCLNNKTETVGQIRTYLYPFQSETKYRDVSFIFHVCLLKWNKYLFNIQDAAVAHHDHDDDDNDATAVADMLTMSTNP